MRDGTDLNIAVLPGDSRLGFGPAFATLNLDEADDPLLQHALVAAEDLDSEVTRSPIVDDDIVVKGLAVVTYICELSLLTVRSPVTNGNTCRC